MHGKPDRCNARRHLLILPPNTTHLYQALDKLFTEWHAAYLKALKAWKARHGRQEADRQAFKEVFESTWPKWVRPEQIKSAFTRVGWSETGGVDKSLFPDWADCFKLSDTFRSEVRTTCQFDD